MKQEPIKFTVEVDDVDKAINFLMEKHLQTDDEAEFKSFQDEMIEEYKREKGIPNLADLIEERRNRNGKTE